MSVLAKKSNFKKFQFIFCRVAAKIPVLRSCGCDQTLDNGIITDQSHIGREATDRLSAIIKNYIP